MSPALPCISVILRLAYFAGVAGYIDHSGSLTNDIIPSMTDILSYYAPLLAEPWYTTPHVP